MPTEAVLNDKFTTRYRSLATIRTPLTFMHWHCIVRFHLQYLSKAIIVNNI